MKYKIWVFLISLLITVSMFLSSAAVEIENNDSSEANYYAVIFGVEKFKHMEFDDAVCIDEDAISIYEKLLSCRNWDENNIKMLLNENGTKPKIQNTITGWLDDKENENDIVLVYLSGHGWKTNLSERKHGNSYYLTYNCSTVFYNEDVITDKELDNWLDALESKHVIVILDHCYSGRMLKLRQNGRIILAAGGKYLFCPVDEDITLGHGIFTFFLLQGMDGVADTNDDGWITAQEAFRYARWPTFWFSFYKNFPFITKGVGPQIPFIYNQHIGKIPFLHYKLIIK